MRKNTARHWLHAGLDLLPLILIPVFMIYSHRHTIDSGSIEVPQYLVVDFNQQANVPDFERENYYGLDIVCSNNTFYVTGTTEENYFVDLYYLSPYDNFIPNHKYFFKASEGGTFTISSPYSDPYYAIWTCESSNYLYYRLNVSLVKSYDNFQLYFQIFDLTQMFGVGNEPTIEQFIQWYPLSYYEYTLSRKELLQVGTQTYDDTDIMSQFTYQLYNSVDKYFNMGNVFGMSGLYDWFNLNIFGGNASISIYIVWNIVLYEFVMDLLFLLYALFMWFIDVTKRLIEKPLDSIK